MSSQQPAQGLEADLRQMILGNVTIAPSEDERRRQLRGDRRHTTSSRGYRSNNQRGSRQPRPGSDHFQQSAPSTAQNSAVSHVGQPPGGGLVPGQVRIQQRPQQYNQHQRSGSNYGHQSYAPRFRGLTREELNTRHLALEQIIGQTLASCEMSPAEFEDKNRFRQFLEHHCREAAFRHYSQFGNVPELRLIAFGSFATNFGMPGSDMDLALSTSHFPPDLPRVLQKALLDVGVGARLLSRTRVPILKICANPTQEIYEALLEDRAKWDAMTPEERERFDLPAKHADDSKQSVDGDHGDEPPADDQSQDTPQLHSAAPASQHTSHSNTPPASSSSSGPAGREAASQTRDHGRPNKPRERRERVWHRERPLGPLDFPKDGVGIQCDINFQNPLGICNTQLLRCYSRCDVRIRLLILCVKAWASRRKINSARNGTLSSYGYVLMVLHFLVNVAKPAVCPNLQLARVNASQPPDPMNPMETLEGWDVRFWSDEQEIEAAARRGLTTNHAPLGVLLHDFFNYYAQQGPHVPSGGFAWTKNVLSLRTPGGILSKEAKGWTGATTTVVDNKEVRNRYLFAVEDPFELSHNVARTVTHYGIVAIREEFRRAWRIMIRMGNPTGFRDRNNDGELMDPLSDMPPPRPPAAAEEAQPGQDPVDGQSEALLATDNVARMMNDLGLEDPGLV